MTLPAGVTLAAGRKQTVTERGWFAPPFTGCRFAVIAQICLRMGYDVPLERSPDGAPNFVYDLQQAGDNTPGDGSTMRQGQKAMRALLPNAPILFGTLTDTEFADAVGKGATVGFAVNCAKLPAYLKNYVGSGYVGGHYMAIDGVNLDGTVDLSDPMYRPAKQAKPRTVPWDDISPAIERDAQGAIIVTMGYADTASLAEQIAAGEEHIAALQAANDAMVARITANNTAIDAFAAQLQPLRDELAGKMA
jgi:hypothetical protein